MNDFDRNELEWLTGMYLDGMASGADVARLNRLLAADREAARAFARICRLDSYLAERYRDSVRGASLAPNPRLVASASERGPGDTLKPTRPFVIAVVAGLITALALGASALCSLRATGPSPAFHKLLSQTGQLCKTMVR